MLCVMPKCMQEEEITIYHVKPDIQALQLIVLVIHYDYTRLHDNECYVFHFILCNVKYFISLFNMPYLENNLHART